MQRAETRNSILKFRMDRRSQARQPILANTIGERLALKKHEQMVADMEARRQTLLLDIAIMAAA